MTEVEWLACDDPPTMLDFLGGEASERRLRLFTAWCCRSIWKTMKRRRSRVAVTTLERYIEGLADAEELASRHEAAYAAMMDEPDKCIEEIIAGIAADAALSDFRAAASSATQAADVLAHLAVYPDESVETTDERQDECHRRLSAERAIQCRVIRDIFGNPFRPVAFNPAWRTTDVMLLARGIYEERAFDRMPILADALQDAGCDSDDILSHCRDPLRFDSNATHVRGCWALDLVLGKE